MALVPCRECNHLGTEGDYKLHQDLSGGVYVDVPPGGCAVVTIGFMPIKFSMKAHYDIAVTEITHA